MPFLNRFLLTFIPAAPAASLLKGFPVKKSLLAPVGVVAVAAMLLTGCTDNTKTNAAAASSSDGVITVSESETECKVGAAEAPSGQVTFRITNTGSKVNEFELLAADGLRILGELENIGPGVTRDLQMQVEPGDYQVACVPGMIGAGTRLPFKISDSGAKVEVSADRAQLQKDAVTGYTSYVKAQSAQLLTGTQEFVKAFKAGDEAKAKELYAKTRTHFERIEPVAESFGDLDPAMDLRLPDVESGTEWTGWHRAERDLWPDKGYKAMTEAERKKIGDKLMSDTQKLYDLVYSSDFKIDVNTIGNGAMGLMDEVAATKVTGEEEFYSRTDLYDFASNVDGARVAFETLEPLLKNSGDDELIAQLKEKFTAVQTLLAKYKDGEGYVSYDKLTKDQVKELADAVNALSEPLSKLTKAAVKVK